MLTYDVKIWSIRKRPNRANPYQLRWKVGPQPHSKSYRVKEQADGRRTELLNALRDREQFDVTSGLPASEFRRLQSPTWYAHASGYARMKWPSASAKHRAGIAEALATITPVLVRDTRGAPARGALRIALYAWAFRFVRDEGYGQLKPRYQMEEPQAEIAAALDWMSRKSVDMAELDRAATLRTALDALSLRQDGAKAAETTIHRKYTVFSNALRYAVECEVLAAFPLSKVDWQPPDTDDEIDFRYVPNPRQARSLIAAVREQGPRGEHLEAFFGCLYYAAMRPGEVAALSEADCVLPAPPADGGPETKWGELVLAESRPEVGAGWTDDGRSYEQRGLKRRARKATRSVPVPPVLVTLLRSHGANYGTAPDGRLFRAAGGGRVRSTEYADLWKAARQKALSPEEAATPLAEVPYSLRHAGVSLWLSSGVEATEVARRAGHSVAVLYRFYAKVITGRRHQDNERIAQALAEDAG
ncbi:site-specific integrase [Streptomyces sp. NBC_01476]|uniref:tyrosine-type recombinase/integrase n=1 Tax=Streptomyces sp. NBC_01476 TaxID=2903881 RepID=UPI002E2FDC21|nr:site-specific integrase [Streptomyces sp. NBC_01476]